MPFMILNKTTGQVLASLFNDRAIKPWLLPSRDDVDSKVRELLLKNPENTYQVFESVGAYEAKVEVVSV